MVKAAFQKGPDGVTALPLGRLAYAPYALLYGERIGRTDDTIVAAYLTRLEGVGVRAAARRVWTHYLLSLEPDDAATHRIAEWLKAHMHELPDRLRAFTEKYNVLDPTDGPRRMAIAALEGDVFIADVVTLGITLERLRTSALMVSGTLGSLENSCARVLIRLTRSSRFWRSWAALQKTCLSGRRPVRDFGSERSVHWLGASSHGRDRSIPATQLRLLPLARSVRQLSPG